MNIKTGKGYFRHLGKLFTQPGGFLSAAMEQKQWIWPFLINGLLILSVTYWTAPALLGEAARYSLADGIQPGPLVNMSMALMAVISFFLEISVVALLLYVFFGVGGSPGQYVHFFSLTMNGALVGSGLPALLFPVLALFSRRGGQLSLLLLFPAIAPDSLLGAFLFQVEFFSGWFLVAVTLGISRYADMSRRRSFLITGGYFCLRLAVLGFLTYFAGQALQNLGTF